ncbi:MAG: ribonuclease R [Firmicutes bacterium]|nr:ribonuclease R [Bacillota bacterium]
MFVREKILVYMRKKARKPVSLREIRRGVNLNGLAPKELRRVLEELAGEGEIVRVRKGKYGLPQRLNMVVGRLQGHPEGYGFVLVEEGEDVYVKADSMQGAMHNDRVLVKVTRQMLDGRSREGKVIRVLKRANEEIVGVYSGTNRYGFVVPAERRICQDVFIPKGADKDARNGDLVVAAVTKWPQDRRNPEGRVIEIIGHKGEPGVDILAIMKKYHLQAKFPANVWREAVQAPVTVRPDEYKGRLDLRHLSTVTIDNEDARDLDDALSIEKLAHGNYLLGVHIADVAHYVAENSGLDREAQERGVSVYLVDRVIPMLPPSLSNGICSLNKGEERLTLTVFMEVDPRGQVVSQRMRESVIKVQERLTYKIVEDLLTGEGEEVHPYCEFVPDLRLMEELCGILKRRRTRRGSIDFHFRERKVILDEAGKPQAIEILERNIASDIVEEFMVLANEVVAEYIHGRKLPFLYRVHEKPKQEDLHSLREFLHNLGYTLKSGGGVGPQDLQKVLWAAEGKPEERLVNEVVLRSLKQARYYHRCLGHFALAAKYYTHFTAPIRRYPDLLIHRIIKGMLRGTLREEQRQRLADVLPALAEEASRRERVAEEAERESVDLKVIEYMMPRVGQVFPGVISGVMPFGIFVELENGVEGLVHISNITDDYYHYLKEQLALLGERTKRRFRIGDRVKVELAKVDLAERTIDFELVE